MNIADVAPASPTIAPGLVIACVILAGLVVTGLVTLVVWLVRRRRRQAEG